MSPPRLEISPGCFVDAPDNVVPLASEQAVDQAWEVYREMAVRLMTDPQLRLDRSFNEELTRRHEKWKRLFLIQDGGQQ